MLLTIVRGRVDPVPRPCKNPNGQSTHVALSTTGQRTNGATRSRHQPTLWVVPAFFLLLVSRRAPNETILTVLAHGAKDGGRRDWLPPSSTKLSIPCSRGGGGGRLVINRTTFRSRPKSTVPHTTAPAPTARKTVKILPKHTTAKRLLL